MFMRRMNEQLLLRSGYHVVAVEDGERGWEALHAGHFDLLITDNDMPRLTGVELVRKLRATDMALPVVMTTGAQPTEELQRYPALHITAVLLKPFDKKDLLETVANALLKIDRNPQEHLIDMLHEFLTTHRQELIERCRIKVAQKQAPAATKMELEHGVPLFLEQLIKTLQLERTPDPMQSFKVSGPSGGGGHHTSELEETAGMHGRELMRHGFTVDQVVHNYGDLCQAITDLAFELKTPIEIDEFRTLNRCLDNGIADAVTEFNFQHDFNVKDEQVNALNKRLGVFAHELRNQLNTATLALHAVKSGNVGLAGATGAVLENSLAGMRSLINSSLTEVRITAGLPSLHRRFSLSDFIAEMKVSAILEAHVHKCILTVADVDPHLAVDADRDLLASAIGNLLQNAFKFTKHGTEVRMKAYASGDRILIDVEDHCGGLPPGDVEKMFVPFTQSSEDHSGLGLGLSIARSSVEANQGTLSVRDLPGEGCIFTIDFAALCHTPRFIPILTMVV